MSRAPDFASLLEELIGERADAGEARATPAVDYLSALEELEGERRAAFRGDAVASYRAMSLEEEFTALLDRQSERLLVEDAPSLSPEDIAAELKLDGCDLEGLAQARRRFALRNHPDRVAPQAREHAVKRMQIANALIDEARRKRRA